MFLIFNLAFMFISFLHIFYSLLHMLNLLMRIKYIILHCELTFELRVMNNLDNPDSKNQK